eukprot:2837339-Lingulodinium_polyedra.AAC.1
MVARHQSRVPSQPPRGGLRPCSGSLRRAGPSPDPPRVTNRARFFARAASRGLPLAQAALRSHGSRWAT